MRRPCFGLLIASANAELPSLGTPGRGDGYPPPKITLASSLYCSSSSLPFPSPSPSIARMSPWIVFRTVTACALSPFKKFDAILQPRVGCQIHAFDFEKAMGQCVSVLDELRELIVEGVIHFDALPHQLDQLPEVLLAVGRSL